MRFYLCLPLVCFVISSCSPGLGPNIRTNDFSEALSSTNPEISSLVRVEISPFQDARPNHAVGSFEGRPLDSESDVARNVQQVFESELKNSGAQVGIAGGPVVSGRVLKWYVDVSEGFPVSRAVANAAIEIEIVNQYQERVFRAQYTGDTTTRHPLMSQGKVEKTLGAAMKFAVNEALNDEAFIDALNRHSSGTTG